MSFTINSVVFKIFLPIIVGLAIFGTLDSIKVNSLDGNVDNLNDAINSFDRTVTFGDTYQNEEEEGPINPAEARSELKEVMLYNMLIAQRCDFLKAIDEAEVKDFQRLSDERRENFILFYPPAMQEVNNPFDTLREEDEMSLTCAGAKPIAQLVKPPSNLFSPEGPKAKQANDMEGKFGKINFETEKSFVVNDPRIASTLIYEPESEGPGDNFPDFWRNDRVSLMVPSNLRASGCKEILDANKPVSEPQKKMSAFYDYPEAGGGGPQKTINVYKKGLLDGEISQRAIYAFRFRMVNVPMIKEGYTGTREGLDICSKASDSNLKRFLIDYSDDSSSQDGVRYLLCEDSRGYIQSNAGKIDNEDESNIENFDYSAGYGSDVVFPRMVIESGAYDCIENNPDLTVGDQNYIAPALDINQDQNRERCTYEETKPSNSRSEEWRGMSVKCGLVEEYVTQNEGGRINFYNTVWLPEKDQCGDVVEMLGESEILSSSSTVSYTKSPYFYGNSFYYNVMRLEGSESKPSNQIRYDVSRFEDADEIVLRFHHKDDFQDENSDDSRMRVSVNEGRLNFISEAKNFDFNEELVIKDERSINVEDTDQWSRDEEEPYFKYKLRIIPDQNKLTWSWLGGTYTLNSNEVPDNINSIKITQQGGKGSLGEVGSLRVKGDFEC